MQDLASPLSPHTSHLTPLKRLPWSPHFSGWSLHRSLVLTGLEGCLLQTLAKMHKMTAPELIFKLDIKYFVNICLKVNYKLIDYLDGKSINMKRKD